MPKLWGKDDETIYISIYISILKHTCCCLLSKLIDSVSVLSSYVNVKSIFGLQLLSTVGAGVKEGSRKMSRLHMTQHIALLCVVLSTNCTKPAIESTLPFHNISVEKTSVLPCNSVCTCSLILCLGFTRSIMCWD